MSAYYNQGIQVIVGNGQNFPGTPRVSLIPFIQNAYDKGLLNFTVLPPGSILLAEIQNISTSKLLGRSTAGTGVIEELTIGTGLSLVGGVLTNTATASPPGGSNTQIQYNNSGAFAGSSQLVANIGSTNTLDITGSGNTSATNALRVRNSSGTNLLNIRNDGKVGIGTTTPAANLHVYSGAGGANSGVLIESSSAIEYSTVDWRNNAGAFAQMFFTGSSYNYGIWESNEAGLNSSAGPLSLVAYNGSGYIKFGTGGFGAINERMRITSSGKVGISTTTPLAGLHNAINTTASTPSLLLSGTGYAGGTGTTTKPTLLIEPTGTTSTGWSTSGTKFGVNAESGFTGNLLDLQINGVNYMSVLGDGTFTARGRNTTGWASTYKLGTNSTDAAINGYANNTLQIYDKSTSTQEDKPNAILNVTSTSKGFLPPRMTTAQRNAVTWVAGDAGMIIFNTTLAKLQVWNGSAWETITSS